MTGYTDGSVMSNSCFIEISTPQMQIRLEAKNKEQLKTMHEMLDKAYEIWEIKYATKLMEPPQTVVTDQIRKTVASKLGTAS